MKVDWLKRDHGAPGPFMALCLHEDQLRYALKRLGVKEHVDFLRSTHCNATVHFMLNQDGKACAIVCLGKHDTRTPIEIAGLLVHEAVHIWQNYCEDIGETNPGSEQEAYAIQSISMQLMDSFVRQTA